MIDLTMGTLLLLLTLPAMAVICLAIMCEGGGPVFHRQARVGRGGRPFSMWKFRTMHIGAHAARHTFFDLNESDGHLFKISRDPRVTPVGRYLRRASLDELPQLFNVVRGEMSLVGPRPLLVEDSDYTGPALERLRVPPGVTGLWQVSGRSDLPWEEMLRLDLHYVVHQSTLLDLAILCRTVPAVLTARGAR
ncbi:sugar transferase [Streptacidiphilus rugosus]|uniref:sugar transferase n=1 Tax=Streptacidiphilus rugosus TaxID=405783 RepID=UPI001E564C34|nr:sugar transferase [Streptacidiphilus rugosus]